MCGISPNLLIDLIYSNDFVLKTHEKNKVIWFEKKILKRKFYDFYFIFCVMCQVDLKQKKQGCNNFFN